ncbi:MAG TPA: hypothetical protein VFT87_01650 [Candidatus Saccharimonadales bacterium]|nr:hypothetical protein [Candidatus Saccharimonadales bacterium]
MNIFLQLGLSVPAIPKIAFGPETLQAALSLTFIVVGALCVFFIIIGAARYAVSAGDPALIKQAKETIVYAVIGLVVSLSAFSVVQFVLGGVT